MKIFATLALAAAALAVNASATTYTLNFNCTGFTNSINGNNPGDATGQQVTGTLAVNCGAVNLSGISNITGVTGFVLLENDFASGNAPLSSSTNFSIAGMAVLASPDKLIAQSNDGFTTNYSETSGLLGSQIAQYIQDGVGVQTGYHDTLTGLVVGNLAGVTVTYTNTMDSGSAQAGTGYARVIYQYTTSSGTPEPVSMVLFGSGLLALSVIGRKKFARK